MRTTSTLDSVKYIMHLAWPAIIEQILLTAATYVDTAMIGALGYHATAAMAVDAPITWLISGRLFCSDRPQHRCRKQVPCA